MLLAIVRLEFNDVSGFRVDKISGKSARIPSFVSAENAQVFGVRVASL